MKNLVLALVLSLISALSVASEITLSLDSYSGTGCPLGSLSAIKTHDGSAMSILFDEFYTEIPQYDQNNDNDDVLDRVRGGRISKSSATVSNKNCLLKLVSTLKEGHKVDSLEILIDSRGATTMDPGVLGRFMTQLESYSGLASYRSRSGRDHLVGRKMWRPTTDGTDEDWTISSSITVPVNSKCALRNDHQIDFKLKSHMILMNRTGDKDLSGYMALDTTDINSGLKLKVNISSCRGSRAVNRTGRTMRTTRSSRNTNRRVRRVR